MQGRQLQTGAMKPARWIRIWARTKCTASVLGGSVRVSAGHFLSCGSMWVSVGHLVSVWVSVGQCESKCHVW